MTKTSHETYLEAMKSVHSFQVDRLNAVLELLKDVSPKVTSEVAKLNDIVPSSATDTLRNIDQNLQSFVQNLEAMKQRFSPPGETQG